MSIVKSDPRDYNGIILSRQLPIGTIVKALSRLLSAINKKSLPNNIIWLSDWIIEK